MKNKLKSFTLISIFIFLLLPKTSFALAGWSEMDYEYYYSPKILIDFNTPSDLCYPEYDPNQSCIKMYYSAKNEYNSHIDFKHLELMSVVNLPQTSEPKYILGKSYIDKKWFIFDIINDKILSSDLSYGTIEQQWEKLDGSKPVLVSVDNFSKYFKNETEDSKLNREDSGKFAEALLFGMFGVPAIAILVIVGIIYLVRFFLNKRKR